MGFWSQVGGAAKAVGGALVEKGEEMKMLKAEYSGLPDDKLKEIFKGGDSTKKALARAELKRRGY